MNESATERTPIAAGSEVRRVGGLLRRRVAGSGLSQKQVERRLGWGEGYLSQLLTGKVDLKLRHFYSLAEVLGFSPREFFAELYSAPAGDTAALRPRRGEEPAWSGDREDLRRLVFEILRELVDERPRRRAG